jgi:hypothetical protein
VSGIYAIVKRLPRGGYLIAIVVAQSAFIVKSGGDWMGGGRFIAPAAIPLILIELLGVEMLVSQLRPLHHRRLGRNVAALAACALVASSMLPLLLVHSPVWQLRGVDDRSMLGSGENARFAQIWLALPGLVRCLHAGQLVATSEVSYLGFARQDLEILDLRGLTSRAIAMGSPASFKTDVGVVDPNLLDPSSPVGRVILREEPALIATFDAAPRQSALGGRYRLETVVRHAGISMGVYVPTDSRQDCSRAIREHCLPAYRSPAASVSGCVSPTGRDGT